MSKDNQDNKNKPVYNAASIKKEEGAEAHRLRVSRYLGASDVYGILNQLFEVIDNSADEEQEYFASYDKDTIHYRPEINITIRDDYSAVVEDFGRGIPCDNHPDTGEPAIYLVMESDSAGGKGRNTEGYQTDTAGVHGAGLAVAKSCTEYMKITVNSGSADGRFELEYKRGERVGELKRIGDLERDENGRKITGTRIEYKYDDTLFSQTLSGRRADQPIFKHMISDKLKYLILGCEEYMQIRLKFRGDEEVIFDHSVYTPENFLGDSQLIKVKTESGGEVGGFKSTLYLSLQTSRIEPLHKTIVNRLNMEKSPNNAVTVDVAKEVLDDLLRRDNNLHPELKGSVVPTNLLRAKLSFLNVLSMGNAEYSGQTKNALVSTSFLPEFTMQLTSQLRESEDFITKMYYPIKDLLLQEKRLEKEKLKIQEKIKREREIRKERKTVEEQVNMLGTDAYARALRREKSRISIKSSPFPPEESTIIYVEGKTGSGVFNDLHSEKEYPIAIASLEGKLPNVLSDKALTEITIDNRVYCLKPGYKDIAILTDADTDGDHIDLLLLYQIWKYARHYLVEGRVYLIPSTYSKVYVFKPMVLNLYGQVKAYGVGPVYTFSAKEHQSLMKAGARFDTKYKGLADSGISPLESVKNRETWIRVKPVIAEDITLLEKVLEEGSPFKSTFMSEVYSSRQFFSKKVVNTKKEIELNSKELHKLLNKNMVTETPELMNYLNYVDKNRLKEFGVFE